MFFKGGRAAKWSKNIFRQEADTGVFPIQTWGEFEQQFQLHFFPANTKADVINALEGTSYHQGNQTVDDYLDSVTLYKRLGKISDILHLNNKNNQLERRVRPPKDIH